MFGERFDCLFVAASGHQQFHTLGRPGFRQPTYQSMNAEEHKTNLGLVENADNIQGRDKIYYKISRKDCRSRHAAAVDAFGGQDVLASASGSHVVSPTATKTPPGKYTPPARF